MLKRNEDFSSVILKAVSLPFCSNYISKEVVSRPLGRAPFFGEGTACCA